LGVAGQIDREGNLVGSTLERDSAFENIPVKEILQEETRAEIPIYVENDSKAAAWGEYVYGAGRGTRNLVCLTIGSGIGGGVILNGQPVNGARGLAGHLGLISVDMNGPINRAGVRGAVEEYASGNAIARAARSRLENGRNSVLMEMAGNQIAVVDSNMVFDACEKGDPLAKEVVEQAGYALGIAIASLLHIFEPERVVIGGGVAERGEIFLCPVRQTAAKYSMRQYMNTPIVAARLGNRAGVIGAGCIQFVRAK
jgi:glucokinase